MVFPKTKYDTDGYKLLTTATVKYRSFALKVVARNWNRYTMCPVCRRLDIFLNDNEHYCCTGCVSVLHRSKTKLIVNTYKKIAKFEESLYAIAITDTINRPPVTEIGVPLERILKLINAFHPLEHLVILHVKNGDKYDLVEDPKHWPFKLRESLHGYLKAEMPDSTFKFD
jgi:hypothetical protein